MANGDRIRVKADIEEMLAKAQPLFATECCIYRVPHELRKLNEDAYTPKVVSIGPFHHGSAKLLEMEGHKQLYCQYFIKRSKASLDDLLSCVQELEPRVRRCYSESIKLGVDELVKMILIDSGFIIELFMRSCSHVRDDVIFATPPLKSRIIQDLLLLENQLPFFVFEEIYNLAFVSMPGHSFLELVFAFYSRFNEGRLLPPAASSTAHFTDLLRTFYVRSPNRPRPSREQKMLTLRYSASELNDGGVKFISTDKSNHSMLDLKFSDGILKIPHIRVEDPTELLLRNMVALEQCLYPEESVITDYVIFLDLLINTDKDVDVLVKNEIIENLLGDNNTVAVLFNGLAKEIMLIGSNADYLHICKELTAFYEDPWHTRMATLRRDYCDTPWKTAASIAGIILLILTIIQTVCSILSVVPAYS